MAAAVVCDWFLTVTVILADSPAISEVSLFPSECWTVTARRHIACRSTASTGIGGLATVRHDQREVLIERAEIPGHSVAGVIVGRTRMTIGPVVPAGSRTPCTLLLKSF